MNNNNDNTENSSSNSPSVDPSSAVESLSNECTTNLTTPTSNEASKKFSIAKTLTIKRTFENQNNRNTNTVNVAEEENPSTSQNAEEISNDEPSTNPGPSGILGTEIVERVTNFTISSNINDNDELTNRDENNISIPSEQATNPANQNEENNTAISRNETPADLSSNKTTVAPQTNEQENTNRSLTQEHSLRANLPIASFPEPQRETLNGFARNAASPSTRSNIVNAPTSYQNIVPQTRAQRCYRALSGHVASSIEVNITPSPVPPHVIQGPPPLAGAPPSYSAVMRLGARDNLSCTQRPPIRMQPSPPFIAPIPPPPYAEIQGHHVERPMFVASVLPTFSVDQMVWGPDPLSVVCPRCANVVVTSTQSQRSNLTHFSALALCLCGCWPCCLLPYCMDSCKNTSHHCPSCQQFLGMYRPW